MPTKSPLLRWCPIRFAVRLIITMLVFVAGLGVTDSRAQALWGFSQPYSPFLAMPWVQGEVRVTPIWMQIVSGKNTLPAHNRSWDLRGTFNMTKGNLFLDIMGRLQVGRLSLRVTGEERDFGGYALVQHGTGLVVEAQPRLEFTGCRVGGDIDVFCRNGIRAGFNCDYYCYTPIFTESVVTPGRTTTLGTAPGKKLVGENPWTAGFHVSVTVPREFYGAWPVFEARMSWPIVVNTSPEVTDLDIAAGMRGPGTILGNLAVRFGYRRTSLSFQGAQLYNPGTPPSGALLDGLPTVSKFDVVMSGWFGELVYYY